MNIFVLSTNPTEAASYHCDQHLHKMILESAQMLSTAAHKHFPRLKAHVYAPAYQNHPCTIWVSESISNMDWLCSLAIALNSIRESKGSNRHSSMDVIDAVQDHYDLGLAKDSGDILTPFAEAMFLHIKARNDLSTVEKYRLYYRKKHAIWIKEKGKGMTWKNRETPEWMFPNE